MNAGAAEPRAIAPRAASETPPPRWALAVAWAGAVLFVISLSSFVFVYGFSFGRVVAGSVRLQPILLDIALFSVFAAHHSAFARTGLKAWVRGRIHPSLERSLYTWISSLLFLVVCWRWEMVEGVVYRIAQPWASLGYATQACGVLLIVKGSRVLDVLDLAGVRQVLVARAASAARHVPLVTDGVFGLVRHPIYLGWTLVVFGAPHMTSTRFTFALVSTLYLAIAVPWEERALAREFGGDYANYRRMVRWRMIPGIY